MCTNIFGEHFRKLSSRRLRRWKDNIMISLREQVVRTGSSLLECETVGKDCRRPRHSSGC
jgi:hypothetical protein